MPYRKGTLVTQYQELDEYTGYGERTCSGYESEDRDDFNPTDVCVGMVVNVNEKGVRVRWVQMCTKHMEDHSALGYYKNDELYEIGQLA